MTQHRNRRCRPSRSQRHELRNTRVLAGLAETDPEPITAAATQVDLTGTYTVREVAEILQVATDTVYEMVHTGAIPHVRVGKQFRTGRFALWAFVNGIDEQLLAGELVSRSTCEHCGLEASIVMRRERVTPKKFDASD